MQEQFTTSAMIPVRFESEPLVTGTGERARSVIANLLAEIRPHATLINVWVHTNHLFQTHRAKCEKKLHISVIVYVILLVAEPSGKTTLKMKVRFFRVKS